MPAGSCQNKTGPGRKVGQRRAAQQGDAADEPHGGWKDSKVAYLHLRSASQLIAGVSRAYDRILRTT